MSRKKKEIKIIKENSEKVVKKAKVTPVDKIVKTSFIAWFSQQLIKKTRINNVPVKWWQEEEIKQFFIHHGLDLKSEDPSKYDKLLLKY